MNVHAELSRPLSAVERNRGCCPLLGNDLPRDHGHAISKNNVEVLAKEEGWFKRKVRKAIEINTRQPTINPDQRNTTTVVIDVAA